MTPKLVLHTHYIGQNCLQKCLEPMLKAWRRVHEIYMGDSKWADHPWWYGERACIGMLAAAVWKAGGIALEEYSWEKKGGRRLGRCDIWIKLGRHDFFCEAKMAHVNLQREKRGIEHAKRKLEQAAGDVGKVRANRKLGLCFAPMSASLPRQQQDLGYIAIEWVAKLLKDVRPDFAAWLLYSKGNGIS